jgi:hypothetical protein
MDFIPASERESLVVMQACDGDLVQFKILDEEIDWVEVHRLRLIKLAYIWQPSK